MSLCLSEGNWRNKCVFSTYMDANACFIHSKRSAEWQASVEKMQTSFHSFRKHLDTMSPHLQTIKNQTTKRLAASMPPNPEEGESTLIWLAWLESLKSPGNVSKIIKEAVSFIKPWSKEFLAYCACYIVSSGAKCLHLHNIIGFMGVLWVETDQKRGKTSDISPS